MRESYVPLFQSTMTSSLWAQPSDVRVFWFSLLMMADPEGCVCGTLTGLALAANVPVETARRAMALFEGPDPESRTPDHDGRRVERVPRGWRILNLETARQRARDEAEKARKRRWAKAQRERDHEPPELEGDPADREPERVDAPSTARSAPVDASKPTPKPLLPKIKNQTEEGEKPPAAYTTPEPPPPPPHLKSENEKAPAATPRADSAYHDLEGFEPSAGLVTYAERFGLPPMALHARLRIIRTRKVRIGGKYGVPDREEWCRDQLPRWKTWWLDDGGRAEPLPVARRRPERPSSPAPLSECIPMPEALLRFVATGQLPPMQPRAAPAAVVAA